MDGTGAGGRGLHAVRIVAVVGAVRQAPAAGRRVRVAARAAAQVAGALGGVRVPAGPGAAAPLHRAAVRVALWQAAARARRALVRARVRVRVLLLSAARQRLAVHHHVVARRLQQPRA